VRTGTRASTGHAMNPLPNPAPASPPSTRSERGPADKPKGPSVLPARLLIGLVVLLCAEVFSGSIMPLGLWHPWTLLVTYWLYFAHFFFFTTLAVRSGRTSLSALYLWGVLFGLYESWITKVIWYGYSGDGQFVLGHIGPYGFSELSMVFLFHPLMSFLLPLAVGILLCPPLGRLFPDLKWLTGPRKGARILRGYLLFCLVPTMAVNSGGALNLVLNLAAVLAALGLLWRWARPALAASDGYDIVVFGRGGLAGLCVYLALLYGLGYFALRPEGLPSIPVQLGTFVVYALALAGLRLHRRREPGAESPTPPGDRAPQRMLRLFAGLLLAALACTLLPVRGGLYVALALNGLLWTPVGLGVMLRCLLQGLREWRRGPKRTQPHELS